MESITIKFTANGQTLTGGGLYCASNTVRYIIAEFDLGDNWQGYDSVRAVWSTDFKCISTVLDPSGSCTVPHEVLERRGKVSVNLVGSILEDDELTDRLTTYPVLAITVDANAQICGTETTEITPSQFEQFVSIIKEDADRAEEAEANAKISEDNAKLSEENAKASEDNAKVSEENAHTSEVNAHTSEINAKESEDNAKDWADKAEQSASDAGFMEFYIDQNGHLIMEHTTSVDNIDFELVNGHLIMEVA